MNWIDIAVVMIVIVSGIYGYARGFISALFSFSSYFLAIIGAKLFSPKIVTLLSANTLITKKINIFVEGKLASIGLNSTLLNLDVAKINQMIMQDASVKQAISQNPLLLNVLTKQSSIMNTQQNFTGFLTNLILTTITMGVMFIIIKILISFIGNVINKRVSFSPLVGGNKTLGLIFGVLSGLIISTLGLIFITPLVITDKTGNLAQIVNNSVIAKNLIKIIGF